MKISENALSLIEQFEGVQLKAYKDPAGVWTIGYGHTGGDVVAGLTITRTAAEQLLTQDVASASIGVSFLLSKRNLVATQDQFDALVSFAFNCGVGALDGSSIMRLFVSGDVAGAGNAFLAWNRARINGVLTPVAGLTRRRGAERALFLGDVSTALAMAGAHDRSAMPQVVMPPPKADKLRNSPTTISGVVAATGGVVVAINGATTALNQVSGAATAANAAAGQAVNAAEQTKSLAMRVAVVLDVPFPALMAVIGLVIFVCATIIVYRRINYWRNDDAIVLGGVELPPTPISPEAPDDTGPKNIELRELLARARSAGSVGAVGGVPVGGASGSGARN